MRFLTVTLNTVSAMPTNGKPIRTSVYWGTNKKTNVASMHQNSHQLLQQQPFMYSGNITQTDMANLSKQPDRMQQRYTMPVPVVYRMTPSRAAVDMSAAYKRYHLLQHYQRRDPALMNSGPGISSANTSAK